MLTNARGIAREDQESFIVIGTLSPTFTPSFRYDFTIVHIHSHGCCSIPLTASCEGCTIGLAHAGFFPGDGILPDLNKVEVPSSDLSSRTIRVRIMRPGTKPTKKSRSARMRPTYPGCSTWNLFAHVACRRLLLSFPSLSCGGLVILHSNYSLSQTI